MFTVECQMTHRHRRGIATTYRTSRQPHVPAAIHYARYVWTATEKAWRHDTTMTTTLRDDAGRIIKVWDWRRV